MEKNYGIIYGLVDKNNVIFYVGSTTDFNNRKKTHKFNSKYSNIKVYKYIREDLNGIFNIKVIKQIDYECDITEIEQCCIDFLRQNGIVLYNEKRAFGRDIEKLKETEKKYKKNNKTKIKERQKKYYEENIEKKKEYYNKNKEQIKEYYNENKNKNKYTCLICNYNTCYKKDLNKHLQSKIHKFIETIFD